MGISSHVAFTAMAGSPQSTTLISRVLCLRVNAKKIEPSAVIAQFTGYPFVKIPVPEAIKALAELARSRQIAFLMAAFTTRLTTT